MQIVLKHGCCKPPRSKIFECELFCYKTKEPHHHAVPPKHTPGHKCESQAKRFALQVLPGADETSLRPGMAQMPMFWRISGQEPSDSVDELENQILTSDLAWALMQLHGLVSGDKVFFGQSNSNMMTRTLRSYNGRMPRSMGPPQRRCVSLLASNSWKAPSRGSPVKPETGLYGDPYPQKSSQPEP